jgi:eukaryotic-like serine/threonine-protein kinase
VISLRQVERYALYDEIASGGMATVYLARLRGQIGFSRLVAMKALHAQYAKEEAFRAMFLDEARLVSRVRHPNVVPTIDVLEAQGELFLVMDYVHGESLARLLAAAKKRDEPVPIGVACSILIDTLEGLHAAHEATGEDGAPLSVVHRDVSPQNILVGVNGVAQVADFGIAKAAGRLSEKFSLHNSVKGKAGYMAPEQVRGKTDRRSDVYAAGVVLWETLVGEKLFTGDSFLEIVTKALDADVAAPSTLRDDVSAELDAVVRKAIVHDVSSRFATAREMAVALEKCGPRASQREVGAWVAKVAGDSLERRSVLIAKIESGESEPADAVEDEPVDSKPRRDTNIETLSDRGNPGVAPITVLTGTISEAQHKAKSNRSGRTALVAIVALGFGSLAVFGVMHSRSSSPPTTVQASSAPSDLVPPPPAISASVDDIATASASAPTPTTSAAVSPSSTKKKHVLHHEHVTPKPPSVAASGSSTPCHWEQLPDEQGIMIPKKVCP